ncbi:MAG: hypothetical protein N2554_01100, partial [Fimbriimonadales bacterium]|nr:hypothetical protein [Fimbriimonadales bacterium]
MERHHEEWDATRAAAQVPTPEMPAESSSTNPVDGQAEQTTPASPEARTADATAPTASEPPPDAETTLVLSVPSPLIEPYQNAAPF